MGCIEHPCIDNETAHQVQVTLEPATLQRQANEEVRGISLSEAIQTALTHNEVIETSALGGVGSAGVLTNPRFAASVYDPAIQESGVLFGGGLGLEAALSRFDPQFTTSALWGRSTATLTPRETAEFTSRLSKQFATGGTVALGHNWNYLGDAGKSAVSVDVRRKSGADRTSAAARGCWRRIHPHCRSDQSGFGSHYRSGAGSRDCPDQSRHQHRRF